MIVLGGVGFEVCESLPNVLDAAGARSFTFILNNFYNGFQNRCLGMQVLLAKKLLYTPNINKAFYYHCLKLFWSIIPLFSSAFHLEIIKVYKVNFT